MSENLDRKGMRKEWQALMHLFVISVRVLFNANLIKGRISVIAPLQLKPRFSFWFPAQDTSSFLSALSYTMQSPEHTHAHAHTLRLKGPGIGQHSVDCFNKSSNQILAELMQM